MPDKKKKKDELELPPNLNLGPGKGEIGTIPPNIRPEDIPEQPGPQQVPEIPPIREVPPPRFFGGVGNRIVEAVEHDGSIFLQELKPSQQLGIPGQIGGLSAEAQAIETQNILSERARRLLPEIEKIGQVDAINIPSSAGLGLAETATTGAAALGAGIAGAKIGAIGGPVGSLIIGGIAATGAAFTKISFSKRQDVTTAFSVYKTSSNNMEWIINEVNAGRMNPIDAIRMWNNELANFNAAERNIKKLTDGDIDRFLSGGMDERAKIEGFRRRLPFIQNELKQAILFPNPNKIISIQNSDALLL